MKTKSDKKRHKVTKHVMPVRDEIKPANRKSLAQALADTKKRDGTITWRGLARSMLTDPALTKEGAS